METPIAKAIKQFEELKEKAPSLKDMIYLDGVLAVLDTIKPYEEEMLNGYKETLKAALKNSIENQEQESRDEFNNGLEAGREDAFKYAIEMLEKHFFE